MRIQHNIMAMNAYRNYTNNTSALSSNLEKLSSGYKINRAGDDAAGLAISEKMRAQITGLDVAQKNAKDGISLVQTAEGALTEVHDMLNRMVELATQSANGTYDNETDRANLQKEMDQLLEEINRIADSANFNGINLLDGTMDGGVTVSLEGGTTPTLPTAGPTPGTNTILHADGQDATSTVFEVDLSGISYTHAGTGDEIRLTVGGQALTSDTLTANSTAEEIAASIVGQNGTVDLNGATYNITQDGSKLIFTMDEADIAAATGMDGNFTVAIAQAGTAGTDGTLTGSVNVGTQVIQQGNKATTSTLANTNFTLTNADVADGAGIKIGDVTYVFAHTQETLNALSGESNIVAVDLTDLAAAGTVSLNDAVDRLTVAAQGNEMFTVGQGATAGQVTLQEKSTYTGNADLTTLAGIEEQFSLYSKVLKAGDGRSLELQIGDTSDEWNKLSVDIQDMHTDSLGIDGLDISEQGSAQAAIDKIKAAINTVSSVRGTLGATQNRLDHTINNLSVMEENIQDAESTIRDTDVAEEMMEYTKNNILIQSAQAMLAQANQVPQGVLQLLQ